MFRAFVIACLVAAVSAFAPVARGEFVQNGCDFIEIHRNCGMRPTPRPVVSSIAHRCVLPCLLTHLFRTYLPSSFLSPVASRITVNKMSPADLMTSTDAVAPMAKFSQVRGAVCGEGGRGAVRGSGTAYSCLATLSSCHGYHGCVQSRPLSDVGWQRRTTFPRHCISRLTLHSLFSYGSCWPRRRTLVATRAPSSPCCSSVPSSSA